MGPLDDGLAGASAIMCSTLQAHGIEGFSQIPKWYKEIEKVFKPQEL